MFAALVLGILMQLGMGFMFQSIVKKARAYGRQTNGTILKLGEIVAPNQEVIVKYQDASRREIEGTAWVKCSSNPQIGDPLSIVPLSNADNKIIRTTEQLKTFEKNAKMFFISTAGLGAMLCILLATGQIQATLSF